MSAFEKFDPRAYRDSSRAKAANPAKAAAREGSLSRFSHFSRGRPDPARRGIAHSAERLGVSWSAEDWRAYFDERAGIAEFGAGLARDAAEARAFESCVCEWLNRNSASSSAGRCVWCGEADSAGATILPFGLEASGRTWLHDGCWPDWNRDRREQAVAALAAIGINAPDGFPDELERVGGV
jgi:hypothetical protein